MSRVAPAFDEADWLVSPTRKRTPSSLGAVPERAAGGRQASACVRSQNGGRSKKHGLGSDRPVSGQITGGREGYVCCRSR
jgi:hypothetical protein